MRLALVLLLGGCSSILGISDPVPAGNNPDGGSPIDSDPGELESVAIAPDPLVIPLGLMRQVQVIGTFSDGSTQDLTEQSVFSIDSGDAITITPAGIAHGITQGGSATIRAITMGSFVDTIAATVGTAAPASIELSLGNISLKRQQRAQIKATIVFSDGAREDGTASVTWSTDAPASATVDGNGRIDAQDTAGPATITASLTGIPSSSIVATVGILVCHPVINEIQSSGNNSAEDEWAEILNPCTVPMDVTNWTLNYRAAADGAAAPDRNLLITLAGQMAPGELRLFGGDESPTPNDGEWGNGVMQRNSGGLGLRSGPTTTGTLVDSVAYGSVTGGHPFIEGSETAMLDDGISAQRRPFDGNDTDDAAANFVVVTVPSPRLPNVP